GTAPPTSAGYGPPGPFGPDQTQQLPPSPFGPPPQYPGGPPGYFGPSSRPRRSRMPLLIVLSVLLAGALVGGIAYLGTRKDGTAPTAGTAAPTPTVTPSPSATETETPSETSAPTATGSGGSDSQAPSDPAAQGAADEFMSDLQDQLFNLAWVGLCDAGKK